MNSDFSLLHLFFDFLFLSCSFQLYKFIRWRWWRCLTGIGQYIYMYFHIYEVRIVNVICSTYYVVCGGTAVHIFVSFDVTIAAPESLLKYNFETWNFLETVWWVMGCNVKRLLVRIFLCSFFFLFFFPLWIFTHTISVFRYPVWYSYHHHISFLRNFIEWTPVSREWPETRV